MEILPAVDWHLVSSEINVTSKQASTCARDDQLRLRRVEDEVYADRPPLRDVMTRRQPQRPVRAHGRWNTVTTGDVQTDVINA